MDGFDYEKIAEGVEVPERELTVGEMKKILAEREEAQASALSPDPPARQYFPVSHEKYQGIAEAKGYIQDPARIQKTRYSHDAMIDVIIAEPKITQKELAARFERNSGWISRIIGSDAFQAALAKRREEVSDPFLTATMEERFRGLASQSIDVLVEKLDLTKNADVALKALDISSKALGFGARSVSGGQIHNNFVVQLPNKMENSGQWAEKHTGGKLLEG